MEDIQLHITPNGAHWVSSDYEPACGEAGCGCEQYQSNIVEIVAGLCTDDDTTIFVRVNEREFVVSHDDPNERHFNCGCVVWFMTSDDDHVIKTFIHKAE